MAIKQVNEGLLTWLHNQDNVDWVQEVRSKNGDRNMIIKEGSESSVAHNMKSPRNEARLAVNNMILYKEDVSIVIGFGFGYLIKAMLNKMEKGHKIVVFEPVANILRFALSNFDFSEAIISRKLMIIHEGKEQILFAIQVLNDMSVIPNWILSIDKYTMLKPEIYGETITAVTEYINQIMCNTGTIAGAAGAIIADNDIACMPYVIRHRGVAELKDIYKNKPAILVSTGPSLSKNIHNLIGLKDKVIIIAVGQALRVLLAYDIVPDFICTVDFGEVNMGHFKGLMDSGVPLVTINRTYADLIKAWKGPKFIAATPVPGYEDMAAGILKGKGFLQSGGSVAHLCFALAAESLGCSPIVFVGQDLAVGEKSHIPLADAAGDVKVDNNGHIEWKVKDHRCSLHDEGKKYSMGPAVSVPGYYGKTVMTNVGLAAFKTAFEGMIKQHKDKEIINATEGGCMIIGAAQLPLKEVIEKYCKNNIDKSVIEPLLSCADDGDELISKVVPLLKDDLKILKEIIDNSTKGLKKCKSMKNIADKPAYKNIMTKQSEKTINRFLREANDKSKDDKAKSAKLFYEKAIIHFDGTKLGTMLSLSYNNQIYSEKAFIASAKNPLVSVAIYGASRAIQSRGLKTEGKIVHFFKNKNDAMMRLKRNDFILNAAKNAAESLNGSYKKTLDILKKYDKTKDDSLLTSSKVEPVDLSDADEYFKAGNWAHPFLDADKAMLTPLSSKEYNHALAVYTKAINMRGKAIEEAKKAEKKDGDKMSKLIRYNKLLDDSKELGRDGSFDEALEMLKEAAKLLPKEVEARWGVATALHHSGDLEASAKAYEKLVKDFPKSNRFKFEYGQVLLYLDNIQEGMKQIGQAMEGTNEFDSFQSKIGDIYKAAGMHKEAIIAYKPYLQKFQFDFGVWIKFAECLVEINEPIKAKKAFSTALKLKPGNKLAKAGIKMCNTKARD